MILLAVRWYLRYELSFSDVEVDHVTVYRWVQRFTPLAIEAARPCRHSAGDHWFIDETYPAQPGNIQAVSRAEAVDHLHLRALAQRVPHVVRQLHVVGPGALSARLDLVSPARTCCPVYAPSKECLSRHAVKGH